jgi:hypothetical protein
MTVVWAVIFFFAFTAASSAYLTLGESFPAEIRATAFSLLFGVAMLVGVLGSLLSSTAGSPGICSKHRGRGTHRTCNGTNRSSLASSAFSPVPQ